MVEEVNNFKKLSEAISGARAPRLYHIKQKKSMVEEVNNFKKLSEVILGAAARRLYHIKQKKSMVEGLSHLKVLQSSKISSLIISVISILSPSVNTSALLKPSYILTLPVFSA